MTKPISSSLRPRPVSNGVKKYTITIESENAPGLLYRIAGTLLRKKINIESLSVKEVDPKTHISRFTLEIFLEPILMERLIKQLERIVEVTRAEYRES
ncbi:MAG: ACT domain-containing protein [Patescibacteria group bacterium]